MVIISTSAVEVSIHAVSPVLMAEGGAAAACAYARLGANARAGANRAAPHSPVKDAILIRFI
jgi:hypothetical protein